MSNIDASLTIMAGKGGGTGPKYELRLVQSAHLRDTIRDKSMTLFRQTERENKKAMIRTLHELYTHEIRCAKCAGDENAI